MPVHKETAIVLRSLYGRDIGLTADWAVSTWSVKEVFEDPPIGIFITDNEDDTYSLLIRIYSDDDNDEIIELRTWEINNLGDVRKMERELSRLR